MYRKNFPNWKELTIHESSPCGRGASNKLKTNVQNYIATNYFPEVELGTIHRGFRCENLEKMTFEDESIDLHITQDVMEHIFSPTKAFQEIARTLTPGGAHIFTTPLVNKNNPSEVCARLDELGNVIYFREPEYHGNPISEEGSLVTMRWGYDICEHIFTTSGLFTEIIYIDSLDLGIRAELIEVLITRKSKQKNLIF